MRRAFPTAVAALALSTGLASAAVARAAETPWLEAEPAAGLPTRSAALILSGQEGGELAIDVAAFPVAAADGTHQAIVVDVLGVGAAAADDGGPRDRVDVYLYAVDAEGGVAAFLARSFAAPPGPLEDERLAVKLLAGLVLEPGDYSLRTLVRHQRSGRFGLRSLPLTVAGATATGEREDAPPIAIEAADGWVVVASDGPTSPPLPEESWRLDDRRVVPSTKADDASAWARIVSGPDGPALRRVEPPSREAAEESAGERRGAASPVGRRIWPGYSHHEARYIEALALLPAEGPAVAGEAVVQAEEEGFGGSPSKRQRFGRGQARIGRSLARADSSSLAPLIALYEALYRQHHAQKRYWMATHSRTMVLDLAQLYVEREDSAAAHRLVADALVSIGAYLVEIGSVLEGRAAFERAVEHDRTHPRAMAGVAVIDEAYGEYGTAREILERLLEIHPDDAEARLRLAVNLRRLGKEELAAEQLESLLAPPTPPWIRALACQQLATLLAGDREQEAVALLDEAIDLLPDHAAQLRIQLASLLDRRGDWAAAREVLRDFHTLDGAEDPSARLRYGYTAWSERTAVAVRRDLAQRAARDRPALAAAIDRLGRDSEAVSSP